MASDEYSNFSVSNFTISTKLMKVLIKVPLWLSGRALDLRSLGRGFDSPRWQLGNNLGQVVHTYVPLSRSSMT